jgi:hypothetical protein
MTNPNELTEIVNKRIKFYEKYYYNYDVINMTNVRNKINKNTNPISYGLNGIIYVYHHNNSNKPVLNDLYMSRNYALNCFIPKYVVLFKAIQQLLLEYEITIKNNRYNLKDFSDLWLKANFQKTELTELIKHKESKIEILMLSLLLSWLLIIYLTIKLFV